MRSKFTQLNCALRVKEIRVSKNSIGAAQSKHVLGDQTLSSGCAVYTAKMHACTAYTIDTAIG